MTRSRLSDITCWITEAALANPRTLASHLCDRLAIGRPAALRLLRALVKGQWLCSEGSSRRPCHRPGLLRQVVRRYPLAGLHEDLRWSQDFATAFTLTPTVARMVRYVFTELINNAIDHSGGSQVVVSMRQTPNQIQLLVSDDGRGLFDAIGEDFRIEDPTLAMLELAKGKLTSQPDRHTGRGLFFAARLADVIDLHANAAAFQQREWQRDQWLPVRPACRSGTSVYVAIRVDTERTVDDVLRQHSLDGEGYGFDRTVVPLRLLAGASAVLESRAQARRAASRLGQFRRIDVDFAGVTDVGHSFADELFRVFGCDHPGLQLVPVNMAPRVAAMVDSIREPLGLAA